MVEKKKYLPAVTFQRDASFFTVNLRGVKLITFPAIDVQLVYSAEKN